MIKSTIVIRFITIKSTPYYHHNNMALLCYSAVNSSKRPIRTMTVNEMKKPILVIRLKQKRL